MSSGTDIRDELVEAGLLSETVLERSAGVFSDRLPHQLTGIKPVRWREEDVTTFMGYATGALERGMLLTLTARAGLEFDDGLRLITGREAVRASENGKLGSRNLDLVIARWQGSRLTPLAAIEAKFDAKVNGTWKCTNPAHIRSDSNVRRYSNQIICYPMGCGHADLRHDEGNPGASPRFVWLWDGDSLELGGVQDALVPADEHIEKYHQAWVDGWELQERYRKIWRVATWSDLRTSVVKELKTAGFDQPIIDAALRPLATRSMARGWELDECSLRT